MGFVVRNLYDVGGRWKYRKVISASLRPHINGNLTEFVRWLGSTSQSQSELLLKYASASKECEGLITVAKKRASGVYDDLSTEMIAHIIATARSHVLHEDEEDRFDEEADNLFESVKRQLEGVPGAIINTDPDRRWNKRQEVLEPFLAGLRHDHARGRIDKIHLGEIEELCLAQGLHIDKNSLGFRRLGKAYLGMMIEVSEAMLERQQGEVVPTPLPPSPLGHTETPSEGLTIRKLSEKKLAMNQKGYTTTEATETALRLFEGVYGQKPMSAITRREVSDWIVLLQQKPKVPAKQHRGLGLKEMVALYAGSTDIARLSGKSINGHVGHLNSIWNWARKRGHIDRSLDNPFSEQRVEEATKPPEEGFTSEQLQALFNLPIFTTGERPKGGRGETSFWLPLLLLTYGTRPEEMCQLLVSDVYQDNDEDGIWCLRITDEGDHPVKGSRAIKVDGNPLVRRSLPITKLLIELGFIGYVEWLKRSGETALFPALTVKGKRGYLHENFATWWGEYVREHGAIPETGNKPLRGFRAAWTTAAARSDLSEEVREWIQGHYLAKARTSNRKYGLRNFGQKIEEIQYKGLDLTLLKAPSYLDRPSAKFRRSN